MLRRRTMIFSGSCVTASWILAAAIAIIPSFNLGYFGDEFYGNNGVCLPLQIHDPFSKGWQYSMVVFCGINSLAFGFITYAYTSMFVTISRSKLGLRSSQQQQDRTIAKRFAFIVITDMLCWVPIIVIKILSVSGGLKSKVVQKRKLDNYDDYYDCDTDTYQVFESFEDFVHSTSSSEDDSRRIRRRITIYSELYAWVAVFMLPINSALNPVLYTLTTKLFKQQLARIVYTWRAGGVQVECQPESSGISMTSAPGNAKWSKHNASYSTSDLDRSISRSSLISANSRTSTRCNWPSPLAYIVYQNNCF
ncbi:g-protein coupled receptor GRL101 [Trichonephila clavipes]|nr:g-protein coupled receptor GRL101 [Trichonephila clavipes]